MLLDILYAWVAVSLIVLDVKKEEGLFMRNQLYFPPTIKNHLAKFDYETREAIIFTLCRLSPRVRGCFLECLTETYIVRIYKSELNERFVESFQLMI